MLKGVNLENYLSICGYRTIGCVQISELRVDFSLMFMRITDEAFLTLEVGVYSKISIFTCSEFLRTMGKWLFLCNQSIPATAHITEKAYEEANRDRRTEAKHLQI